MKLRLIRAAGAFLVSAGIVIGPAIAATAGTWTHNDGTGDVRTYAPEGTASTNPDDHYHLDPENTNADITRIKVAHNRGAIVIILTAATALPQDQWSVGYRIHTPTVREREVVHTHFGKGRSYVFNLRGAGDLHCSGMRFMVGRPARQVRATIPRRCFGSPRWVRVGAGLSTFEGPSRSPDAITHSDDANFSGPLRELHLSPRIYVGRG